MPFNKKFEPLRGAARRGFTLMEIMFASALVGIIAAAALAPLVLTVRSLEEAQQRWGTSHNTAYAVDKIYYDVRHAIKNPSFNNFKIIHKSGLSLEDDDRLVVWSSAPKYEGRNVGVVVYKVLKKDIMRKTDPGLYRWVLDNVPSGGAVSGDIAQAALGAENPMETDIDDLDPKEAKMILAEAAGIRFFVRGEKEWTQEYVGDLPEFLRTEVLTKDGWYTRTERFPNASE